MKKLKLDHTEAQLVLEGKKNTTWRLYDDKDLTANDLVELIDKVDAANPATWKRLCVVRITSVIEKPFGELTTEDTSPEDQDAQLAARLQKYQTFYGSQVQTSTPVKVVKFTIEPETQTNVKSKSELELYADGGSRGNPGPSASSYVLQDLQQNVVVKKGEYIGVTTNNQAEYQALKLGLEEARAAGARKVHVYMDSLLVINQMLGIFKVKNRDLWPIHDSIVQLAKEFEHISFTHVPREMNKIADRMVNEVLDAASHAQARNAQTNARAEQQ